MQGIEQFDIRLSNAFLASWSPTVRVPMDIYMTRDPCENDMLTDSNSLYKIQLFSYQKWQRTSFEARSTGIPLSSALKIELADGN